MSYKIIGNTEYKSINEKAYINGSQDDIMRLAQELDRVGINYSGRISEYRSAITVAAADRVKAIEIMNGLMRKDESSLANAEKNIIGNVEYRYIANKRYIKGETEAMLRTADRLTAENISFSGRINGNTVTLTVSGDEMQERVKKYFSEEINREQTIQSVYLLSPASDGYEDGYYISEVNTNTVEEISPYRSSYGDIPMFVSVDEAIRYTQNAGVELSNTEAQFAEWRKAEEEKEHQLLLERSREIIRQLPMLGKEYEEHFIFRDNAIDWIYFNPDGNDSEGEFVETTIYAADIINAYKERVASSDAENRRNNFLETIIHSCEQRIIEAGTEDFESYAHHFIETSEENNVFKTFGIYENSDYIQNIDTVINRLEDHFEEVRSYTENVVEQLYELAQKELEDFENSLDTAEKAKAAAYELSVKRDILSYIHSDLSNDISDSDTEDACRRLISSGYPLDTFYQDWLKNEYDNRMEAIKMTAADSLRRETQYFGIIENAKEFAHNAGLPFRYDPNEEPSEDFDQYSINASMSIEDYELMHKLMKEDQSEEKVPADQNKSNTLIVNIYGGPGAGKSTTALQLVAELKKRGFLSEYISEVAKEYVYAKNFDVLDGSLKNQKQIFSEQQHRQDLMIDNVDIAITDAPLLLNTIYTNSDEITLEYSSHIMDEYNKYNNYNIYINRDLSVKFENEGRIHNLSESIEKDGEIKSMLIKNNVIFDEFNRDNISEIADKIVEKLPYHEKNNEAVPQNKTNTDLITITCNFSESAAFEDGKTYSVAEFDRIMANADAERVNGWKNGLKKYGNENIWEYNDSESYYKYIGYDKTSFTINFPNGETISERQDIGDGYGGVIDYCRSFSSLQKYVPILEKQRDLDNAVRERDEAEQKETQLEAAKEYIRFYLESEFLSENVSFDDLEHISAGYTELGENNEYGFQMEIDLVSFKISYTLNSETVKVEEYESLEKMNKLALSNLNFDDFVSIGTDAVEEYENKIDTADLNIAFENAKIEESIDESTELVWKEIPESIDEETGKSTSWAAEINSDTYGRFLWISQNDSNSYDVEYDTGERIIPVSSESAGFSSLSAAKEWAEEFYSLDKEASHDAADILAEKLTAHYPDKFMIEEYYNSKAPLSAEELFAYIQNLLSGRQGFGLDGYSADTNGIILSDLSKYSWEQVGRAVMTALGKGTYITPEERAERANAPKYSIYQVKRGDEYSRLSFNSWNELKKFNLPFDKNNYEEVYGGYVSDVSRSQGRGVILDNIYTKFNIDRPEDFRGHSLSVGDVIVLEDNNVSSAFYVDSYGMADVTDLFFEVEKEKIDLSKLSEITLTEEYDRRKDQPDDFLHIKNTVSFSNLNSSYLISRYKEFTYEYDDMPDADEGDSFTTKQGMLAEVQEFFEDMRNDHDKSISITDLSGKTTVLEGRLFEFEATEDRLAFMIPNAGYAEMFERDNDSYDYTFYDGDYNVTDSGVYDDVSISLRQAFTIVMEDAGYDIEKCEPMDFEKVHSRAEEKQSASVADTGRKKPGNEVEVGDVFLYNGREYTVELEKGIYPDDVKVSYEEQTGGISYITTQNIDRYKLAENGVFLGNPTKEQEKENAPAVTEENHENKANDYTPKIGDLIDINDELLTISDISGSVITFTETENLLGNTSRMSIDDFFSKDFTVVEENESEIVEAVSDVPLEHNASNSQSFVITDENLGVKTPKARFTANVEAIRTLNTIEAEHRTATPEEQAVLSDYTGWGAIPQAFDSDNKDWSKEYNELKNLLTDEEYRAARASTMNAHYTSPTVIKAIYDGLANIGFEGGKILEPAMGTGNFFGAMPDTVRSNSELYGVELDSITGRIAKQLYPSANIQIKGYEQTSFENNSFDVAIGNVPFGGYKVNDADYNKQNFFIHDYFFAKTLDKVRPGGVVAFVTSQGTLDKSNPEVRKYLAERAELLGAIRLPNNAFKANAGTEVTSDIIFLQKRERPISIEENTPEWVYKDMLPNGIAVNKYFTEHPEMILGEMVEGNKMYGNQSDSSMCVPIEGKILADQLSEAVKNITGAYHKSEISLDNSSTLKNSDEVACPPNTPKYSFVVMDDVLYYHKSSDTMEKYKAPEKNREQIKAMVQLRDSIHKLLELQLENTNGQNDTAILETQNALNVQYDNFSEQYGRVSSQENKMLFRDDNSYHLIKSLEKFDKNGNFIGKADIFSKNTINPRTVVDHCDNAQDALILSLSEKMCVNFEYMSQLTGKSEAELIEELGDKIFQNPQKYMRWESADEYLTGNIRTKLAVAEAAGLIRNVEALRAVMPKRIEAADISVKLSSAWVAPEYIKEFIVETLKPDFYTSRNIEVTYMQSTDKWKIENWRSAYSNTLATETYGTHDINAYEIIEATLNMQKVEIRERVKDELGNYIRDKNGRYVYELNQQKTMIAQSKQDDLKRKFSEWIFADPNRREKLVDTYNENFNSVRLREYDGSHLNFVGMNSDITLKEHQKNAVARGLYSNGNTLLAHEVGSGKTFEMIAIAMEGKRLGLHNKPLITAPNGLTEQWGNAFRQLYPSANVLVATEKDFQKENRRDLFAKIATGDWDAVVIGHSQFDMIHLSRDRELNMLNSELDRLEAALSEMIDENGKKGFSVKQIEKAIKSYQDKIEKLLAKTPEDDMLCFEKLGIDKLFVDESQAYKNLDTPTKMRNVSGIGSGGSGRAMQLLMKCKYLDELTGGKGCVFASGTPISNSMSEMYTLMRYLQADKLEEMGINSFDRWASVFGETVSSMELSPEGNGKYQMKTRFAKFQNLPELMNIFKETADIKTADTLNLDRPDFEMHNVNVPATAIQASMIKELGQRAKEIRSGNVDPTEDNMCKLTVDGRKIGLDQRCINPNLPDDPKSKVNVCINNVFDIWQKTSAEKSTQLIFCDLATPQPTLNENTYSVYRPNIDNGYSKVFTAKLNEKDTAEKIMKKLNGSKPPKNYDAGEIADGDIIMLKRINYEEEKAYNTAFEVVNGKLTEVSSETWEKLHHAPIENFASERKYCVYDDIKQKLIAKGVPEKEIAFIHDVDKAEEKQALYDKMNKGEIRVLIGSTFKCGAGMNAQERMIALHDLDAPMRPSDMEQRHGRIIRQGNTNSKVDIYRYTTDKTFDAYLYQMLENKQKFISQIMTDKSPVRSCEDVDEVALDYAEVKALCAGNPLIKEKIDLETEITKLNVIKSAFLSQKYSLQDKAYKTLPEQQTHTEKYITKLKSDLETVHSVNPLTNEDGKNYYPIVINGKEYHDKEEAGNAIRQAIMTNGKFMENKECTIGSYRGFELKAFIDTHFEMFKVKVNLRGACDHYGDINMDNNVKASGNIVRLDNIINGIDLELQKQEDRLQSISADIKEAREAAEAVFPQEAELSEKEKRLAQVNSLLTNSDIRTDHSTELYAALVEICPELENYDSFNSKYEKGEDSEIEPLIIEKNGNNVFIAHIYTQNGDLMYDPAVEFSFDTKNHRAEVTSYQLDGMGIYEDFSDGTHSDMKTDVEEMALDTLFENIKSYNYDRTVFNAENNSKETGKENSYDFAR